MSSSEGLNKAGLMRLNSALDEAAIVAITDKSGVITYVNKKFCAVSKYSQAELVGKTHKLINSNFHPATFFENMWQTIRAGQTWEGEVCNRAKDGSLYWVDTTIVPFLDASGEPEQYVAVRYEVTERKNAEEQLKVYAKKLEISNQELQDFASVAAHDLQEPLRKIQAFSDRLKKKAKDLLSGDSLDYLNRIENSAKRMQILINDLLTYSRVTTQAKPFELISLKHIVEQVVSELEIRIEQTQAQIECKDLPSIHADSTQMYQLFLNLITNSLKFSRAEVSPKIVISGEIVENSASGAGNAVFEISVRDKGIGFDEKYLDRIFTIFQRLHGRHEYEGTGIGLAICRKIVDRHGGQITASSTLGEGSTFKITLPQRQDFGKGL